jgi:hypothetical protein
MYNRTRDAAFVRFRYLRGLLMLLSGCSLWIVQCGTPEERLPLYTLYVKAGNPLYSSTEEDCIWEGYRLVKDTTEYFPMLQEPEIDSAWTTASMERLYWRFDSLPSGKYHLIRPTIFSDRIDTLIDISSDLYVNVNRLVGNRFQHVSSNDILLPEMETGDTMEIIVSHFECPGLKKETFAITFQDSLFHFFSREKAVEDSVSFHFTRDSDNYINILRLEGIRALLNTNLICSHRSKRIFAYRLRKKIKVIRVTHCQEERLYTEIYRVLYGK